MLARMLRRYISSGQLQRALWGSLDLVLGKIREHIVEPFQDLTTNLFDTLQRRDPIVTHDELVQSHLALNRMLESYEGKIADKDSVVDISAVVSKVSSKLYPSKVEPSSTANTESIEITATIDTSSPKHRLSTSRQLSSMERLMRDYEKELQTPIRGLLFGDLIRSVLIQVCGSSNPHDDTFIISNVLTDARAESPHRICNVNDGPSACF